MVRYSNEKDGCFKKLKEKVSCRVKDKTPKPIKAYVVKIKDMKEIIVDPDNNIDGQQNTDRLAQSSLQTWYLAFFVTCLLFLTCFGINYKEIWLFILVLIPLLDFHPLSKRTFWTNASLAEQCACGDTNSQIALVRELAAAYMPSPRTSAARWHLRCRLFVERFASLCALSHCPTRKEVKKFVEPFVLSVPWVF